MPRTLVRFTWVPIVVAVLTLLLATCASAQSVQYVELKTRPTANGAVLYQEYCASCHGATAHGNGPAAAVVRQPVPDLTLVAQRDGAFDLWHVRLHILDAHGHKGMPDWESAISGSHSDHRTMLVVYNLAKHLEAVQAEPEGRAR
jgi:mono/diheme cytochrome c family protein